MWNDPGWAFGVGFIILAISLRKALPRLIHSIAERRSGYEALEGGAYRSKRSRISAGGWVSWRSG